MFWDGAESWDIKHDDGGLRGSLGLGRSRTVVITIVLAFSTIHGFVSATDLYQVTFLTILFPGHVLQFIRSEGPDPINILGLARHNC